MNNSSTPSNKKKPGLAFVVSAPAGTGKTTLVKMLVKEFPNVVASISLTTRSPRPEELNGRDYFFVSTNEFEEKIQAGEFLEHVKLYGDYYGTSRQWVQDQLQKGNHVILTIDTQGALLLKNHFPAVFIFIFPPSIEELKKRLELRKTETPAEIERRMAVAKKEIESAKFYDYTLINDDLKVAYNTLHSILIAEEHRVRI